MRYQKIESRIWHDEKFMKLTPHQQLLFFYILTCPHGNLTGVFVLKPGYATEDIKCLPKDFKKDLDKLVEIRLISYDHETSVILIHNFLKHNPITNPNQRKAVITQLYSLPKSPLIKLFIDLNKGLAEGLQEVLSKPDSDSDSVTATATDSGSGVKDIAPPVPPEPVVAVPYFSCQFFDIDYEYREKLAKEYPALTDEILKLEISKMEDWIIDNRRTKKFKANGHLANAKAFIRNWLTNVRVDGQAIFGKEPKGLPGLRDYARRKGLDK